MTKEVEKFDDGIRIHVGLTWRHPYIQYGAVEPSCNVTFQKQGKMTSGEIKDKIMDMQAIVKDRLESFIEVFNIEHQSEIQANKPLSAKERKELLKKEMKVLYESVKLTNTQIDKINEKIFKETDSKKILKRDIRILTWEAEELKELFTDLQVSQDYEATINNYKNDLPWEVQNATNNQ